MSFPSDIRANEQFAANTAAIEAFRHRYSLPPLGEMDVAVRVVILDHVAKLAALSILFGLHEKKLPFSFTPPPNFFLQRTHDSHMIPSLTSITKIDAMTQRTNTLLEQSRTRLSPATFEPVASEAQSWLSLLSLVKSQHQMVDHVTGCMNQFLHA